MSRFKAESFHVYFFLASHSHPGETGLLSALVLSYGRCIRSRRVFGVASREYLRAGALSFFRNSCLI
jgi:hypothetical protein